MKMQRCREAELNILRMEFGCSCSIDLVQGAEMKVCEGRIRWSCRVGDFFVDGFFIVGVQSMFSIDLVQGTVT